VNPAQESGSAEQQTGWSCTVCGRRTEPFAPSGRCRACEAAVEVPTYADGGSLIQIGAVATLVGLSLRSVRHYEDAGLVVPAGRTAGGFRLYGGEAIERLRLIMRMKPLGFTLDEMRLLIEARTVLATPEADTTRRDEMTERIRMFSTMATAKVEHLREQLAIAEDFAATLQADLNDAD
jgi:MerR family transcriptional regulator, copper efflux regulator